MPTKTHKNQTLDARPDRLDLRDREYRPPLRSLPPQWPSEELIKKLLDCYMDSGMILNQYGEGACTGFGLAAVINYSNWRNTVQIKNGVVTCPVEIKQKKVSTRMLYNMARVYDEWDGEDYEGSSCRGAMKGWHRHGVCKDTTWPYSVNSAQGPSVGWSEEAILNPLGAYYRINKDSVVDMQGAIHEVGAIFCCANVHKGWWKKNEQSLSLIKKESDIVGGHAFAIIGYNADGFIIQNSWGEDWGYKGFAVLSYADWVENGSDSWVAVRGVPIRKNSPETFSNHALQSISNDSTQRVNSKISRAINYQYKNDQVRPWSEEEAYKHSLVIENNGRPKLTLITASDPDASARIICHDNIHRWLSKSTRNKKIVIYAHGGLNAEEDSINRIRIMAPYFKNNGIYPVFVTWKTGFMESVNNQIKDYIFSSFKKAGIDPDSSRAQGIFDRLRESIDRGIEKTSQHILVRGVWTEMKENALYASDRAVRGYPQQGKVRPGGMVILSKALKDLKKNNDFEIHLVAHSAGSILFGHWLEELKKRKLNINSTTLLAPACTLEFANKHYVRAIKNGILERKNLSIHMMDDEREKADSVGPYGKSLLYLVSRALEDIHKMPLLGMAAAWDINNVDQEDGKFNSSQFNEIKKWYSFSQNESPEITPLIYNKSQSEVVTSAKGDTIDLAHGSFDNDIDIIEKVIREINEGKPIKYPVENLGGF
ncbi:MAG: C1 family peptidase [Gammaproteobacteria bacterium]